MGNKDKSLKRRKNKRRSFHGNRFTSFSTEQMKAPPTSSSDKSKNDKVGTSLSAKKLKLNLDSQSSGNDSSVDRSVVDINVDLESSEDDIDTDDDCHSSNFYGRRNTSYYVLIDSNILEEVIDLIGKCPAENCRGKVKMQNNFSKKWDCFATLSFYVRYVMEEQHFQQ